MKQVVSLSHPSSFRCPRCEGPLIEHEPDEHFYRWWECQGCFRAFEMRSGRLIFGRTVRGNDFC